MIMMVVVLPAGGGGACVCGVCFTVVMQTPRKHLRAEGGRAYVVCGTRGATLLQSGPVCIERYRS